MILGEPWASLADVARYTNRIYAPGDDAKDLGRCDVQLLLDGTTAALMALQGSEATPEGNRDYVPIEAVSALLRAYQTVLRGLFGDLRDLTAGAGELAADLERLRGPG